MNKLNRKFVMTKALYILLWIMFALQCLCIVVYTMDSLMQAEWHPIGLLFEGCIWDYTKAAALLLLVLSFKKEV